MNNRRYVLLRITTIAILAALLTIGRTAFAVIPNVQPNTTILILASFILGPIDGLVLAVISTLTSNLFLGNGLWTIGQMAAWGLISVMSGLIGRFRKHLPWWLLTIYSGFCGFLFGLIISIFMGGIISQQFWPYYLSGLPFDLNHAVGNMIFFVILYKPVLSVMEKYLRFDTKQKVA